MHIASISHDHISQERAEGQVRNGTDDLAPAGEPADYQGRHVRQDESGTGAPTRGPLPVRGSHPRRRGFGILSRLARVEAGSAGGSDMVSIERRTHAPTLAG